MPEENLPQPSDRPTTPPVRQADGQIESGSNAVGPAAASPLNPMPPNPTSPTKDSTESPERLPFWLRQSERFLRVVVQMYIGLLVCFAPWTPWWDANPLFSSPPWLHTFITYGAVRGLVSGLGLLNLWIALRDALRGPTEPGQR